MLLLQIVFAVLLWILGITAGYMLNKRIQTNAWPTYDEKVLSICFLIVKVARQNLPFRYIKEFFVSRKLSSTLTFS